MDVAISSRILSCPLPKRQKNLPSTKRSCRNNRLLHRCGRIGCALPVLPTRRSFWNDAHNAATAPRSVPYGSITFHPQNGTPVIFADQMPCYLCEDVPCIAACATEALLPVEGRGQIRMGLASVSHRVCTAGQGCHACASKCPTDALSMDFDRQRLVVTTERCVGCGLCEQVCRTVNDRVAIRVTPFRSLPQSLS